MRGDAGYPVRIGFTKHGKVRFISHRDVARAFERAFRIETLPLAFTQGFSPRPKVSFGLALSVGHESEAEFMDLELAEPIDLDDVAGRLSAALPEGIEVTAVVPLADRAPALQEAVSAVEWAIEVTPAAPGTSCTPAVVAERVATLLAAPQVILDRTRKGRATQDDVRPAIRTIVVDGASATGTNLTVELATRPTSLRPAELVEALGSEFREGRVRRIRQWIERGDERLDPIVADPRNTLEVRAS